MAYDPCDACGQRFFGKSRYVYPAVRNGEDKQSKRLRLDNDCFKTLKGVVDAHMVDGTQGMQDIDWDGAHCQWCRKNKLGPEPPAAFVTLYDPPDARHDYRAILCDKCAGRAPRELLIELA